MFQKFSGKEKFSGEEGGGREGVALFSLENLLSHRTARLRSGNLCV